MENNQRKYLGSKDHLKMLERERIELFMNSFGEGLLYHIQNIYIDTSNHYLHEKKPMWYAITMGLAEARKCFNTYFNMKYFHQSIIPYHQGGEDKREDMIENKIDSVDKVARQYI